MVALPPPVPALAALAKAIVLGSPECEDDRIATELAHRAENRMLAPDATMRYSRTFRGHYADPIERWRRHFPCLRILVLKFDDLPNNADAVCNRVFESLDLPRFPVNTSQVLNAGGHEAHMDDGCRQCLTQCFRPHYRRLFDLIGENWECPV